MNKENDNNKKKKIILIITSSIILLCAIILLSIHLNKPITTPSKEIPEEEVSKEPDSKTIEEPTEEPQPIEPEEPTPEEPKDEEKKSTNKSTKKKSSSSSSNSSNSNQPVEKIPSLNITSSGVYELNDKYECVVVNTTGDVILNLKKVNINCQNGPGIKVLNARAVTINTESASTITAKTTEDFDGAIYSSADLVFKGKASLTVNSNYDGIVSKDTIIFNDGNYVINSIDDGIRGKDSIKIVSGKYTINAGGDGIKSTNDTSTSLGFITIENGTFNITSNNDAIEAKSYLVVNNGTYNLNAGGGYTSKLKKKLTSAKGLKAKTNITIKNGNITSNTTDDGIHSDGNITINNGTINIKTGDDAIHGNETVIINDGVINITNSFEGIEGTKVYIKGGSTTIRAGDDGINASSPNSNSTNHGQGTTPGDEIVEITGGTLKIIASRDGIDSNNRIHIKGGTNYIESIASGPEEVVDHIGEFLITGGTSVLISNIFTTDDGPKSSSIPYAFKAVTWGSGKITMGDISYTPSKTGFKYIIIASPKLNVGTGTITIGNESSDVEIKTGTIDVPKTNP